MSWVGGSWSVGGGGRRPEAEWPHEINEMIEGKKIEGMGTSNEEKIKKNEEKKDQPKKDRSVAAQLKKYTRAPAAFWERGQKDKKRKKTGPKPIIAL